MASAPDHVETFIARWQQNSGGAERANYALFLTEFCELIGVSRPDPAGGDTDSNAYVFERAVTFREAGDKIGHGRCWPDRQGPKGRLQETRLLLTCKRAA